MTEWFALFIPIFLSIFALVLFKHKLTIVETLIPTGVGIILIALMKVFMVSSLTADTEYFSGYVTKATYYEKWNEYIHQTCSRTYKCGDSTCTQYYDCSYVKNHSAYWEVELNTGKTVYVSQQYWEGLVNLFGNKSFLDMKRNYYTRDGDAYVTLFDGKYEKLRIFDWEGSYSNKPQTNETIFHFEPLEETELDGIVEYPEAHDWNRVACIGCTDQENEALRKINGVYGYEKQIHVFVIQTQGLGVEVAERQRRHWKNGNKNELVIVVDKENRWAKSFSWADNKSVEVEASYLFKRSDLTLTQKIKALGEVIDKHWVRKEFKDFDYIRVNLTSTQQYWILGVVFFVSFGCLFWGVKNDIDCDF